MNHRKRYKARIGGRYIVELHFAHNSEIIDSNDDRGSSSLVVLVCNCIPHFCEWYCGFGNPFLFILCFQLLFLGNENVRMSMPVATISALGMNFSIP